MASSKRPAAKAALPLAFASSDMKAGGAKRESSSDVPYRIARTPGRKKCL